MHLYFISECWEKQNQDAKNKCILISSVHYTRDKELLTSIHTHKNTLTKTHTKTHTNA